MARPQVPFEPGCLYHVFNHSAGEVKDVLFRNHSNYERFLNNYKKYIPAVADTFAWCLMPNHFHLLVKIRNENHITPLLKANQKAEDYLAHQFGNLQNAYAKYYNLKYQRRGPLFQSRVKRKKIETGNYFIQALRYIHLNPVFHGFVKEIDDWQYSSWSAYTTDKKTLVKREDFISFIGGKDTFYDMHQLDGIEKYGIDMEIDY